MPRGINKAIIIGNLGQDPDTRYSAQGAAITNLNVATDESYKDKQTGQMVPRTEWHRVVLFNLLAEIAKEYLRKGSKIYVEGRLQTRKWQDQSGQDRYTTEIVANDIQMLDSRGDNQSGGYQQGQQAQAPQNGGYQQPPRQQAQGYQQPPQNGGYQQPNGMAPSGRPNAMDDFDDDIPF